MLANFYTNPVKLGYRMKYLNLPTRNESEISVNSPRVGMRPPFIFTFFIALLMTLGACQQNQLSQNRNGNQPIYANPAAPTRAPGRYPVQPQYNPQNSASAAGTSYNQYPRRVQRPIYGPSGQPRQSGRVTPPPTTTATPEAVQTPLIQPEQLAESEIPTEPQANLAPINEERFAAPPAPPINPGIPRVALLLPLSGPQAKLGQAMLNAAQLALFHFADKQFELLPQDTQGTPEGAADAAALAIGDGASLILGPLFAGSVNAVAPAARAAGIKVIAFSNDSTVAGDGVFTLGFRPSEQVERVVRYAMSRGLRRFAVLAPDNDYGVTVADAMNQMVLSLGGEVTDQALYDPYASDFAPIIRQLANYDERRQTLLEQRKLLEERDDEVAQSALKRLENLQTLGDVHFDALLIGDGGKRLQSIAALLPYFDIDPKKIRMLGTGQWDVPGIGAEPALLNAWFAAPEPTGRATFGRQYKEVYGHKPPRLATLAYDATALAAVFAQKGSNESNEGENPEAAGWFDISELMASQGFAGRDGIFRFTAAGTAERGLSIHSVQRRRAKIIDPAPTNFESVTEKPIN